MGRFRVVVGKHHEGGVVYKVGQELDSNLELDKLFPDRFVTVHQNGYHAGEAPAGLTSESQPELAFGGTTPNPHVAFVEKQERPANTSNTMNRLQRNFAIESSLGENVTSEFPKAIEADKLVFCKSKDQYFVTEPETPEEPLNTNKKAVKRVSLNGFLGKFLKS